MEKPRIRVEYSPFRTVRSHEDTSCILYHLNNASGLDQVKNQVLRGIAITEYHGLFQCLALDDEGVSN